MWIWFQLCSAHLRIIYIYMSLSVPIYAYIYIYTHIYIGMHANRARICLPFFPFLFLKIGFQDWRSFMWSAMLLSLSDPSLYVSHSISISLSLYLSSSFFSSLSIYPSIHLYIYISKYPYIYIHIYFPHSLSLSLSLSVCLYLHVSLPQLSFFSLFFPLDFSTALSVLFTGSLCLSAGIRVCSYVKNVGFQGKGGWRV